MSATHVDPDTLSRAFQVMDAWGRNSWHERERNAYWTIRTEYKIIRSELQKLRYSNRIAIEMWMELATKPKPRCRRRLQSLVRLLLQL